jgi:hypothetical protein
MRGCRGMGRCRGQTNDLAAESPEPGDASDADIGANCRSRCHIQLSPECFISNGMSIVTLPRAASRNYFCAEFLGVILAL